MKDAVESYKRFLKGEEGGLAEIIQAYKDGLIFYLNSYVRDLTLAEELTEEAFIKLVIKRPKFSERSGFKTWLYTIARNLAYDYLRHNKVKEISLEEIPEICKEEADLEALYIQQEKRILIHRAMKTLKAEYQQVLWLVYFEGFSHKEVAKIMEKTTHNVEMLVHRARQALKTKLLKEGYFYEEL